MGRELNNNCRRPCECEYCREAQAREDARLNGYFESEMAALKATFWGLCFIIGGAVATGAIIWANLWLHGRL